MDEQLQEDYEHVSRAVHDRVRELREMQAVNQLKEVSLQSVISWVVSGLAAITFTLVWHQMTSVQDAIEKVAERQIQHEINHPDHELDKRITLLEREAGIH